MTIRFYAALLRHELDRLVVEPLRWRLVFSLPRAVIYWATVRAVAEGVRRDETVPEVPATEIVKRWSTRDRYRAEVARRRHPTACQRQAAHDRLVAPLLTHRRPVVVALTVAPFYDDVRPTSIPGVLGGRARREQGRTAAAWATAWAAAHR